MEGSKQAVDSRTGHRLSETDLHRLQTDQAASNQAVFQVGMSCDSHMMSSDHSGEAGEHQAGQ